MPQAQLSPFVLWSGLYRVYSLSLGGFQLVAAGLCVARQQAAFKSGGPSFRGPLIKVRESDKEPVDGASSHSNVLACAETAEMPPLCGVLVTETSFQQISMRSFSTTAPTWQAAALLTFSGPSAGDGTHTQLLLSGIGCTKAVEQGDPGRDSLSMRDTKMLSNQCYK